MHPDISEVLFDESQIAAAVKEMGHKISDDYVGKRLMMVSVLKGSFVFMSDLIRSISIPFELDFIAVSSYGAEAKSSGVVRIVKDLEATIEDYHILLVEDILDSGLTLKYLQKYIKGRNPLSVEVATLLLKEGRQEVPVECRYVGLVCPDAFVVGYGLDYAEQYRNLPYIGVLDPKVYSGATA
jgi:hypoxanthine phosphoribosyltransferase